MHVRYYLVAVLFLFTLPLLAQIDSEAYKNELKRNAELIRREKLLRDSLTIWKSTLEKVEKSHNLLLEMMTQNETVFNNSEEKKNEVDNLNRRIDSLKQDIKDKEESLKKYTGKLQEKNNQLEIINREKGTLNTKKDDVVNGLLTEYQPYLERLYSEIDINELERILSKCQQFTIDSNINAFVAKIEQIKKNKRIYDEMIEVLSTPFNKINIDRALSSSAGIIGGNALQQNEVNEAKKQLNLYPEGLAAFKDFIIELNVCRKDVVNYSMDYFRDDLPGILSKNNLEKRINNYLMSIPYLKTKYEEFKKQLEANPNNHSEVETEILNQ